MILRLEAVKIEARPRQYVYLDLAKTRVGFSSSEPAHGLPRLGFGGSLLNITVAEPCSRDWK